MQFYQVEALADFESKVMNQNSANTDETTTTPEVKYLSFSKGDHLIVKVKYDNGWLYGSLVSTDKVNQEVLEEGFFPSTYVKELEVKVPNEDAKDSKEEGSEEEEDIEEEEKSEEKREDVFLKGNEVKEEIHEKKENFTDNKRKATGNWMEFVKDIIAEKLQAKPEDQIFKREINEDDILNEALIQDNYSSIIGYKKIKITNDPNQALKKKYHQFGAGNANPTPVLNNEFAMVYKNIYIYINALLYI